MTDWWSSLHFIFCFLRVLRRTAHTFLSFELSGSTVPLEEGLYSSFVVFVRDFGDILVLFCVFVAC